MSKEENFASIKENATSTVRGVIEKNLLKKTYEPKETQTWTNIIADNCVKALTELNPNFKYMVSSLILQKADCGISMSGSCYWDSEIDGNVSVTWENATILCIVTVFAVGFN